MDQEWTWTGSGLELDKNHTKLQKLTRKIFKHLSNGLGFYYCTYLQEDDCLKEEFWD